MPKSNVLPIQPAEPEQTPLHVRLAGILNELDVPRAILGVTQRAAQGALDSQDPHAYHGALLAIIDALKAASWKLDEAHNELDVEREALTLQERQS